MDEISGEIQYGYYPLSIITRIETQAIQALLLR